jgi:hypothetical protein
MRGNEKHVPAEIDRRSGSVGAATGTHLLPQGAPALFMLHRLHLPMVNAAAVPKGEPLRANETALA